MNLIMDEDEFRDSFDLVLAKFLTPKDEAQEESELRDRVENHKNRIRFSWNLCTYTQLFSIQREQAPTRDAQERNLIEDDAKTNFPYSRSSSFRSFRDDFNDNQSVLQASSAMDEDSLCSQFARVPSAHDYARNQEHSFIEQHRRYIKYYNPFKYNGDVPHYSRCPKRIYLIYLICQLILAFWIYQSYCLTAFLRVQQEFKPSFNSSAWRSSEDPQCVKPDDIVHNNNAEYPDIKRELDRAYERLISFGMPATGCASFYLFYVETTICILTICILGAKISYNSPPKYLNSVSFYMSPIEERRRLRQKLYQIVHNLYKATDIRLVDDNRDYLRSASYRHLPVTPASQSMTPLRPSSPYDIQPQMSCQTVQTTLDTIQPPMNGQLSRGSISMNRKCRCILESLQRIRFIEWIHKEQLVRFVSPLNLNAEFHDHQSNNHVATQHCFLTYVSVYSLFAIGILAHLEMRFRVETRKVFLRCKWLYNSTILYDRFHMFDQPVDSNMLYIYGKAEIIRRPDELASTNNLDQYSLSIIMQEFFEWYLILDTKTIMTILSMILAYFWILIWLYFGVLYFRDSYFYQSKWVNQLSHQLDDCNYLLTRLIESKFCGSANDGRKEKVEKVLTITYLNFELFRQECYAFKIIYNDTLARIISIPLLNSLIIYWLVASFGPTVAKKEFNYFWYTNTLMVWVINFYVISCVVLLTRIHELYKKIDTLMARITANSIEFHYISVLWRRQLMREEDIQASYCIQLLGNNIYLSTLIGLDSYVIALWLYLFKSLDMS